MDRPWPLYLLNSLEGPGSSAQDTARMKHIPYITPGCLISQTAECIHCPVFRASDAENERGKRKLQWEPSESGKSSPSLSIRVERHWRASRREGNTEPESLSILDREQRKANGSCLTLPCPVQPAGAGALSFCLSGCLLYSVHSGVESW